MLFKNKKSSLELSIRTIVIVVLAMTLLGLGLGFIRGMFGSITPLTEDVTEQVRQKILDDLITADKKISFPKTEIKIDKGGSTVLTVGIRNKNDQTLYYKIKFVPISDPAGDAFTVDGWFQFDEAREYELAAAESDVRNIRLNMPKTGLISERSYFLTFEIIDTDDNSIYASKDFFIVVRG